jgi:hypothetical protein
MPTYDNYLLMSVVTYLDTAQERLVTAWENSDEPGLLLAVGAVTGVPRETLVVAACAVARLVLGYIPQGKQGPALHAIEAAEAWAHGHLGVEEVLQRAAVLTPLLLTKGKRPSAAASAAVEAAHYAANAVKPGHVGLMLVSGAGVAAKQAFEAAGEKDGAYHAAQIVRDVIPSPW